MNFDPNDPRITAYALGEPLDSEAEAFVELHQDDPDFQAAVAEIRQTAELLKSAFAAESGAFEPLNEAAIFSCETEQKPSPAPNRFKLFVLSAPAIAATIVLVCLVSFMIWGGAQSTPEFVATATIEVQPAASVLNSGDATLDSKSRKHFQEQLAVARSESLALAVVERLSADDENLLLTGAPPSESQKQALAEALMKRMTVRPNAQAYQFGFTVRHPDQVFAQRLANYFADEFINYNVKLNIEESMREVEEFRLLAESQRDKVDKLRDELNEMRAQISRVGVVPEGYAGAEKELIANEEKYSVVLGRLQGEMSQVALVEPNARIVDLNSGSLSIDPRKNVSVSYFGVRDADKTSSAPQAPGRQNSAPMVRIPVDDVSNVSLPELNVEIPVVDSMVSVGTNGVIGGRGAFASAPPPEPEPAPPQYWNREGYDRIKDNEFTAPEVEPLSTFSIDVDTASYANVRRMLRNGQLPPPDAVRIEELINYFSYDYPIPEAGGHPFSVTTEMAPAPWSPQHQLLRIGLKGYEISWEERPASNLVFLIDVSGSMSSANKLGLVKQALGELTQRLDRRDRVAIVVYAGSSGLALPSTTADNQETIQHALGNLQAGGSTNGGQGIELAYKVAQEKFIEGGNNRVILCTDGDFNVGVSDRGQLTRLIEEKAKSGVFLSICGFGMGNYKDDMMETLSNSGNGNYAYIDDIREAGKVFGQDLAGTMLTIAKDVKIQVEFNPANVAAYRLIGYENRVLAAKDFNDDKKDAGEIGAGHTVTALYEIVPVGVKSSALPEETVDPLKYQTPTKGNDASQDDFTDEWVTVKLRYKQSDGDTSTLMTTVVEGPTDKKPEPDFLFATAVAEFGLLLRQSEHAGGASWNAVIERARASIGSDEGGHRSEFVELAKAAQALTKNGARE